MLKEFKDFAMRGNVVDMGVGLVIGAAFGAIVASFVGDVLMPLLVLLLGGATVCPTVPFWTCTHPEGRDVARPVASLTWLLSFP